MEQRLPVHREIMKNSILIICNHYPAWQAKPAEWKSTVARRIERNCMELVIAQCIEEGIDRLFEDKKFINRYSVLCSKVLANLDTTGSVGSSHLIDKLINGLDPYEVAGMMSQEMCPEAGQSLRDNILLRQQQLMKGKVSHAHVCRKCGGNETIPIEYQSRAADEGSSKSIKCVVCGFVWRM